MSEGERMLIEAAAHNCEAALIRGDYETAGYASLFAFFVAEVAAGDHWGR